MTAIVDSSFCGEAHNVHMSEARTAFAIDTAATRCRGLQSQSFRK